MKQFLNFVRKEFIHILRDPLTLLLLLGMPVVEMIIFGFALNMDVSHIRTLVVDDASDDLSGEVINALRANPYFIYEGTTTDREEMNRQLRGDHVDLVILLPKDLTKDIVSGAARPNISVITDATDANIGQIRVNYFRGLMAQVVSDYLRQMPLATLSGTKSVGGPALGDHSTVAMSVDTDERAEEDTEGEESTEIGVATPSVRTVSSIFPTGGHPPFPAVGAPGLPYNIDVNTRMMFNPSLRSTYNFVPGVIGLVLIIICTIMTSVSIAREKERGTMETLLSSPVRPRTMVVAKTMPYLFVSFINLLSILFISYFLLDVPIRGSIWLIFFVTIIYIFLALAIGMVISVLASTQRDAIMISGFGMMMPTIVFSGMIFPIANMPTVLQWVTKIVPANYYISAMRKIMIQGTGIGAVAIEIIILLVMSMLLISLAVAMIRPRLN